MENVKKDLTTKVFEALGEASMCWSETPKGVFESSNAKRIGDQLVKDINEDLPNAITVLQNHLKEDKTGGSYYYAWQSNIAMAFKDEYYREALKEHTAENVDIHKVANEAAKNFLDLLIKR